VETLSLKLPEQEGGKGFFSIWGKKGGGKKKGIFTTVKNERRSTVRERKG